MARCPNKSHSINVAAYSGDLNISDFRLCCRINHAFGFLCNYEGEGCVRKANGNKSMERSSSEIDFHAHRILFLKI